MNLHFERFQERHYREYESWFADPELNRQLGPIDEEWLAWVLMQEETKGITWAIFLEGEMVGVVETLFDPEGSPTAWITGLAVSWRVCAKASGARLCGACWRCITTRAYTNTVRYLRA